jgi:lipopolysaccharide export system protein LptC
MKKKFSNIGADNNQNLFHYSLRLAASSLWLSAFLFMGCENDVKQIKDLTEKKILKEEAIQIEGYLSEEGKMKAKLTAPLMLRVAADTLYVEFPNTLHVDFYDDSAAIESRLDSKYGKYFENMGKVYLRDSVIVINTKGDTLRALDLWWDQNTKLFYSDKYTQFNRKGDVYYGNNGMEATQDLTRFTLYNGGGKMKTPENGFPE